MSRLLDAMDLLHEARSLLNMIHFSTEHPELAGRWGEAIGFQTNVINGKLNEAHRLLEAEQAANTGKP